MPIEITPLPAFNHIDIFRVFPGRHVKFKEPGKVLTSLITVTELEQMACNQVFTFRNFFSGVACNCRRNNLTAHQFPNQDLRCVSLRLIQFNIGHICRPEMAKATHSNQTDQAEHHNHGQCHGTAIQPDPGSTTFEPLFHAKLSILNVCL